jgi:cyanate lyase
MEKEGFVQEALMAKSSCGLTFDEIAKEMGLTNVYTAQLFYFQVRPIALLNEAHEANRPPSL